MIDWVTVIAIICVIIIAYAIFVFVEFVLKCIFAK